jgi:ribosomal-protein-alanine N-acetyltransferase
MSDRAEWMAVRGRNREWLAPWEASNPQPGGSLPTFRDMVRSLTHQAREGSALPFVITLDDPRTRRAPIVGQLTVSSIVWGSALMATLGYWVDREHAGRGIAPTAVAMATDHCFRELGLHRMEINIRPENAPSLRVVEKLRFRREGLRPRFLHINGAWADHESFALTAEEVPAEGLLGRWLASR